MCPHTPICVLILLHVCPPHTTIYVSSYYYICVLILHLPRCSREALLFHRLSYTVRGGRKTVRRGSTGRRRILTYADVLAAGNRYRNAGGGEGTQAGGGVGRQSGPEYVAMRPLKSHAGKNCVTERIFVSTFVLYRCCAGTKNTEVYVLNYHAVSTSQTWKALI